MTRKKLIELRDQATHRTHDLRSIRDVSDVSKLPKVLTCLDENHLLLASMANRIQNFIIVKPRPNPDLFFKKTLYRERSEPFRLQWETESRGRYLKSDEWEVLTTRQFYIRPRTLSLTWGAYLLPNDISVGERVYVSELIEDVSLGGNALAADGIAVWTGDSLEFEEAHWVDLRNRGWVVG